MISTAEAVASTRGADQSFSLCCSQLLASSNQETLVGGTGHYLNRAAELTGGVLGVLKAQRNTEGPLRNSQSRSA